MTKTSFIKINVIFFSLFVSTFLKAQLAGVYSVPGSYATIASAITALNTFSVSGAVTINISAGYTETVPFDGYYLTTSGTSLTPIVFQKNGAGSNPLLSAYSGGTATAIDWKQDGMWHFIGCDYITVNSIDLVDVNTTNPSTMEFGYGFFVNGSNDGCQHNLIENCHITLKKTNNILGSAAAADGSRAIELTASTYSIYPFTLVPLTFNGTNSYNSFYSNVIDNCNIGFSLLGATTASVPLQSRFNDIGGSSMLTGNTIINFGGAPSATTAAKGIFIQYMWDTNISNNIIDNNNGLGANHTANLTGIHLLNTIGANTSVLSNTISLKSNAANGNTYGVSNLLGSATSSIVTSTVSISNNSFINFYQSNSAIYGSMYAIYNASSVGDLQINNNSFTNFTSGASYSIGTSPTTTLSLICNTGLVQNNISITGNTISNYSVTTNSTGVLFRGIYNDFSSTTPATLTINSNSIQSIYYPATASGEFSYIYVSGTCSLSNICNNSCNNFTVSTTNSVSAIYFLGVPKTININANSVMNISKTGSGNFLYGIYCKGFSVSANTLTASNNLFSNLNVMGNSYFFGIILATGATNYFNLSSNTITAISGGTNTSFQGFSITGSQIGSTISNNLIYNINTGGSAKCMALGGSNVSLSSNTIHAITCGTFVEGINFSYPTVATVYKNRVFNLETSASGNANGISVNQLNGTISIFNNLIADIRSPNYTGSIVKGINLVSSSPSTFNVFYNTIYLNAASNTTLFSATGLSHAGNTDSTIGKLNLNNNIIVNNSIASGLTGYNLAFDITPWNSQNYSKTSNNNLFYAGSASNVNNQIMSGYPTFSSAQSVYSPCDVSSVEELPTFFSLNGLNPLFLKLSNIVPTQAESGGVPIIGVTDDYIGTIRNTLTPDIGAWESNYPILDSVSPSITGISIVSGLCNLSAITLTANISDATGVATGSLAPRCYYKMNSGPYFSVQGTLTAGNLNNGNWIFPATYTASPGDILSYYFTAQDISSLTNIGSIPAVNFSATSVNSVITNPLSQYTLGIIGILNGTYTVGGSGNFTTLTAAVNAYNSWCITGPLTFLLIDAIYSTSETFPITFYNNVYANNTNSLIIKPAPSINATISGPVNTIALLKFEDARYIDVDGLNISGSSLNIVNNSTVNTSCIMLMSTNSSTMGSGNKRIGIKNTSIKGSNTNNPINFGIVGSGSVVSSPYAGNGQDNDSITIQNNIIERTYDAISAGGSSSVAIGGMNDWTISGNIIGPAISGPNSIKGSGISLENTLNSTITNNLIRNINASVANIYGITTNKITNVQLTQNTITAISSTASASSFNSIAGLYVYNSALNSIIEKNTITNIYNISTIGSFGSRGITIRCNGSGNKLRNNFISDIYSGGGLGGAFMPTGISVESSSGFNIDNNTVNLASNYLGDFGSVASTALYINSNSNNLRFRNNIFSNTSDNLNSNIDIAYSIYSDAATSSFSTGIDYNNYFVGGTTSTLVLGYINSSNQLNLTALQSSFGGNLNSKNVLPVFTATNNLHMIASSNPALDNAGTPTVNIISDIDNQPRSPINPDIGADEFYSFSCGVVGTISQSITSYSLCSGQSTALNASGGSGNGLLYQWQISNTSGGPYYNVTSGIGATTTSYSTSILNSGNYYYVLQIMCSSSSLSAVSNEATVTVNSIPTVSLSSNLPICIGQTLNLNGSSNIGTIYSWTGPNSFTSAIQNNSFVATSLNNTGVYTLNVSQNSCTNSGTINISLITPTISATVTGPSCTGNSVQFNTYSASSYTWSGPSSFNSNLQNPIIGPLLLGMSGVYSLTANLGACTATTNTTVSVNSIPASPIISSNSPVCAGGNLMLSGTGGTYYLWSGAGSFSSSIQNPTITNILTSSGGNYILTINDINNCSSTANMAVIVNPLPTISIVSSNSLICSGSSAILTASGANTYTWSLTSNNTSINITPSVTTTYSVIGTSSTGCNDTVSYIQNVTICTALNEPKLNVDTATMIYPNPNNGEFYINCFNNNIGKDVIVYNILSEVVKQLQIVNNNQKIDLKDCKNGIYIVKIIDNGTVILCTKIIKN